jgi:2-keto-4-pentenoate hydratase/2-oxohepta-3-ene-1,7-dioic acid hydratase in catechol pathway
MKICRFDDDRLGIVQGEEVCDVTGALEVLPVSRWPIPPGDSLIAHLPEVIEAAERLLPGAARKPLSSVALRAPVCNPTKVVAAPVNYQLHIDESKKDPGIHHNVHNLDSTGFETPVDKFGPFLKANSSIVGPSAGVELHFLNRRNDHEVEVVLVIGKKCKNVARDRAWEVIAGYTMGLDMTVRGGEDRSFRKSADSYSVLGPWLTTADEIVDPENISFSLKLNGELRQSSNTRELIAGIPHLIALASSCYTLHPGDLIYTGTPDGVGPAKPGDVMYVECAVLGNMEVRVR